MHAQKLRVSEESAPDLQAIARNTVGFTGDCLGPLVVFRGGRLGYGVREAHSLTHSLTHSRVSSGAELAGLANDAALLAVRARRRCVEQVG